MRLVSWTVLPYEETYVRSYSESNCSKLNTNFTLTPHTSLST